MFAGESLEERLFSPEKLGLARLETDGEGYSVLGLKVNVPCSDIGADVMLALGSGDGMEPAMPIGKPVCISGIPRNSCPCPRVCSDLEWLWPKGLIRSGSIWRGSEEGGVRFECDLAWRMVGLGDLSKVEREGEGVEWPVKASGVGKTMVEGLLPALLESNWKPSFLFLIRPPQFRRML